MIVRLENGMLRRDRTSILTGHCLLLARNLQWNPEVSGPRSTGSQKYRVLLASGVSGPRNVVVEALDAHVGMKFVGLRRTQTGNCIPVVWVLDCDPMFREGKHEEVKTERV